MCTDSPSISNKNDQIFNPEGFMGSTTIKSTVSLEVETSLHILPLYAFGQEIQTAVALNIMLVPLFYPHCNPSGNKQKMSVRTDESRGGLMRHPAGCVDFCWHTCHGKLQLQFKNEEASATWGHMVTWWWVHTRTHTYTHTHTHTHTHTRAHTHTHTHTNTNTEE